ncbi:hypothetical protein N9N28_01620 [Rubripirellula amarantea]|nr:hypothetical protein [Rubripirellula amarantea]
MNELLVTVAVFALIIVTAGIWGIKRDRDFKRRWPAISDDEFVFRCTPGTNRQRALKVRRIISEQLGVPYEHIHPDQSFVDDLNAD